jgi:hypothetical protein
MSGWFYPTTLTATRRLYAAWATWGDEDDTTTDESRNPLRGSWRGSGSRMRDETRRHQKPGDA